MTRKVLITGFEPFADWKVNPTAVAAEYLDGLHYRDVTLVGRIIPLRFNDIGPVLQELMEEIKPDVLIMTGQAGGDSIRLERNAQNKAESKTPYNCGTVTTGQLLVEEPEDHDGKAIADVLTSSLPLEHYYDRLQQEKIPVRYSDSAGLFGCNQIFYLGRMFYPDIPSGFVHVPLLPEQGGEHSMSQEMITFALQLICQESIDRIYYE